MLRDVDQRDLCCFSYTALISGHAAGLARQWELSWSLSGATGMVRLDSDGLAGLLGCPSGQSCCGEQGREVSTLHLPFSVHLTKGALWKTLPGSAGSA